MLVKSVIYPLYLIFLFGKTNGAKQHFASMTLPTSISGFHIVPIRYSSSSTHYLFIRSHTGPKKTSHNVLPHGRTLFLVNVPPDATERQLSLLFKHCGTVEKVVFDLDAVELHHENESDEDEDEDVEMEEGSAGDETQQQRRKRRKVAKDEAPKVVPLPSTSLRTLRPTGRTAHLIFLDSSSLDRALSSSSTPRAWPLKTAAADGDEEPSGLAHYAALYDSLRPPLDAVREHADTSVLAHEHEVQKAKQRSKYRKGEAIVDEDGFTVVTRGGAYGKTLGGGVGVASKGFQRTGQTSKRSRGAKKEKKEKVDFYGFQKAEKQRKGGFFLVLFFWLIVRLIGTGIVLMDLQKKWEEDKAKVEALKASRKFKPY